MLPSKGALEAQAPAAHLAWLPANLASGAASSPKQRAWGPAASACPGLRALTSTRGGAAQAHAPGHPQGLPPNPARLPLLIQTASHATPRFCRLPWAPRHPRARRPRRLLPGELRGPISQLQTQPGRGALASPQRACLTRSPVSAGLKPPPPTSPGVHSRPKLQLSPPLRRLLRAGEAWAGERTAPSRPVCHRRDRECLSFACPAGEPGAATGACAQARGHRRSTLGQNHPPWLAEFWEL